MILMYLTPDWEEQMTYPVVKLHLLLLLFDPDEEFDANIYYCTVTGGRRRISCNLP